MNANFFPAREKSSLALHVRILGFVIIALSPIAVWLVYGSVAPYGQQQHTDFPPAIDLVGGRIGAFDNLGQATLERSAATLTAILLKNLVSYQFCVVDTDKIISGKNGWLFYKPEFWEGKCLKREKVKRTLAHVDVLTGMAQAAGLDMIVSVSPDKSSIYPDMLAPYYRQYWHCKERSAALWRDI